MKHKSVQILITIGLLLILAAFSLAAYNVVTDMKASIRATDALAQLDFGPGSDDWKLDPDMEMPQVEIDGVWYVGALEIPVIDKQLPVASYWDPAFAKAAPCKYTGTPYKGNMIIAGHNYRQHFGKLSTLKPYDEVYFTDLNGNSFKYIVVSLEQIPGWDIDSMKYQGYSTNATAGGSASSAAGSLAGSDATSGAVSGGTSGTLAEPGANSGSNTDAGAVSGSNTGATPGAAVSASGSSWDLTLFTCNFSGRARIAVRCIEVK